MGQEAVERRKLRLSNLTQFKKEEKMKTLILFLLLCSTCYACEVGKTYMDTYGKPTEIELNVMIKSPDSILCKIDIDKYEHYWMRDFYDGCLEVYTKYSFDAYHQWKNETPKENAFIPFALWKGHRWYPNYHGIIYVYKDGKEHN